MTRSTARSAQAIALLACLVSPAAASELSSWPPSDPGQPVAKVAITTAWAGRLREIHSFSDLQKAAGAQGKLVAVDNGGEAPHAVYSWTGSAGRGQMNVFLYRSGDFGIVVRPADRAGEIKMNNFAAFVCPACSPPIHACGLRPSWVPHTVHWDSSDCGCTLTGPQTIRPGAC